MQFQLIFSILAVIVALKAYSLPNPQKKQENKPAAKAPAPAPKAKASGPAPKAKASGPAAKAPAPAPAPATKSSGTPAKGASPPGSQPQPPPGDPSKLPNHPGTGSGHKVGPDGKWQQASKDGQQLHEPAKKLEERHDRKTAAEIRAQNGQEQDQSVERYKAIKGDLDHGYPFGLAGGNFEQNNRNWRANSLDQIAIAPAPGEG